MPKKSNKIHTDVAHRGVYAALRTLVHFVAVLQFGYAVYYDYNYVDAKSIPEFSKRPSVSHFGGKFKYLTFIDAIVQTIYFTLCIVNDIVGTNEVKATKNLPLVRQIKDFMLASLAFPLAMNVGITFWTLMAIDRELVFPKVLDAIFPSWLNHVMHTNIIIFALLELFISFRAYPNRKSGLRILALFMGGYLIWLHIIRYHGGIWVYPILEVLDFPVRILFFLVILAFTFFLYILGEMLNNMIWKEELKTISKKSK